MGWATLNAAATRVAFDRLGSVSVAAGAVTGRGFLMVESTEIFNGEMVTIPPTLTALWSQFGSLAYGGVVTVDGASYRVTGQPERYDDGMFCRIPLVPAPAVTLLLTTLSGLRLMTQDGRNLTTQPT